MSRSTFKAPYTGSFDTLRPLLERAAKDEGFSEKDYDGERVWKKGSGLFSAIKYIKFEFAEQELIIRAWVQSGASGTELDLSGLYGAFPKKQLTKTVEKIMKTIK